ncbi:histidine phosphatase family protein [Shouchella miscanthi]|uniref:histidine phosphatase family protein n=1 Tax=Shouchella miscanthi TaxID=2598861 RepID=UPI0011A5F9EF|nr:histidine phosphatase family protein [Shouchella miscanthi]
MSGILYFVRHAEATGQEPSARLTSKGKQDAKDLALFFQEKAINMIFSSPYKRAISTIEPTAELLGLPIEQEERLMERCLSPVSLTNWLVHLQRSFADDSYSLEGGESSHEAQARILSVVNSLTEPTIIVSHGNLLALLIRYYQPEFGFSEWEAMGNPAVYELCLKERKVNLVR